MKDKKNQGINPLTMNQKYAKEFKKPIRKEETVENPNYSGLGGKYERKNE